MTDSDQQNNVSTRWEIHRGDMVLRIRETGILTPTETEIVYYMLRGFSQAQIAYVRDRSIKTLSVHKRNICRKVGNATTATLLLALLEKNIITLHRRENNIIIRDKRRRYKAGRRR